MKVVIDIPKEDYRKAIGGQFCIPVFFEAVKNGIPLPKGHGRLIDADALEKLCYEHEIGNSAFDNSPIIEQGHYSDGDCIWKPLFDFAPTVIPADTGSEDKPKTGHCKDCKWWKDSDGAFRRGIGAESKCPINSLVVYEGEGYCYMFEPQESEVQQ